MSEILEEYYDETSLSRDLKKSTRFVDRATKDLVNPLPYLKLGNRKLFHKATVKEWLRSLERKPNPKREPRRRRSAPENRSA